MSLTRHSNTRYDNVAHPSPTQSRHFNIQYDDAARDAHRMPVTPVATTTLALVGLTLAESPVLDLPGHYIRLFIRI
jgi:hypothetical protein